MTTRKRTRQSLPEDLGEDELSPTTNKEKEAQGSLKKRKLNTYGSSPSPNTITAKGKSFFGSVGGKVGGKLSGLFSLGAARKGKENVQPEDVDELSGDIGADKESEIWDVPDNVEALVSRRQSARGRPIVQEEEEVPNKGDTSEGNVSEPGEQPETPSKRRAKRGPKSTPKPVTQLEKSNDKADATPKRSAGRPKTEAGAKVDTTPKRALGQNNGVEKDSISTSKRSGQPRKSDVLKRAKAKDRVARRERMSQPGQNEEEESQPDSSEVPKKRRSGPVGKPEIEDPIAADEESITVARRRGRPKKGLEEISNSAKTAPKGILTPGKKRGAGPRKSVAFEGNDAVQLDLGFKDIDTAAKPHPNKRGRKVRTNEPEDTSDAAESKAKKTSEKVENLPSAVGDIDSEDDDDDVACAICKGLDSEEPNEIIFCENCDNAFHQNCYGVSVVPEGDWLCRDCRPNADDLLELGQDGDIMMAEVSHKVPDIENFEDHLRTIQRHLLDKLTGQKRIRLIGHEQEMQKVHQVVEQTVLAGEGNSMLVIGARGCGKSNLVESVISDLSTEHRGNFHVVRLNGFIHTDDKLALKEIWRQLGREMEVDEDLTAKSNHADTLASLLALLSHPSEISENQENQTAKSVVFILDEFDLFTTHARQTLLYNLFDIAQARKAPIVVLGLTTRVDVVEALEKRVKSRFSHRYVHLSLPRSIPSFWNICKAGLIADTEDFEAAVTNTDGLDDFLHYWQSMIEGLYKDDLVFKNLIQSHFYRTKSVPGFLSSCILPIANLSPQYLPLTGRAFTLRTISVLPPDSKLHILQGLSELELALLIAAARLDIILDTDTCNFAMAYDEYSSLTSKHKIQTSSTGMAALGASAKVWGRDIALGAWERLSGYDLLVPAGIGGGSARDFGAGGRMWKVDVGLEEITGCVEGLSGVLAKWCREI